MKKMRKDELIEFGLTLTPPITLDPEKTRKDILAYLEAYIASLAEKEAMAEDFKVIADGGQPRGAEDVLEVMSPLVDPEFVAELEALAAEIKPRPPSFEYLSPNLRKWRERLHDRLVALAEKCK